MLGASCDPEKSDALRACVQKLYASAYEDAQLRDFKFRGVLDYWEELTTECIFAGSDKLQRWFRGPARKALVFDVAKIAFHVGQILRSYAVLGLQTANNFHVAAGVYYSRLLRYAVAHRRDVYANLQNFVVENFKNVKSDAIDDKTLVSLVGVGIHIAVLREEAAEAKLYSDDDMYKQCDPFTQQMQALDRVYPSF